MDIRKLCMEADTEVVADYIQMDTRRKGKYTYILCPGHEKRLGHPDMNIGNCVLKENGYYCWACGTFVSTHDMVMEYTGCSSDEAYTIMAEAMGGVDLFGDSEASSSLDMPKCRLTQEEANIIGLYSKYTVTLRTSSGQNIQDGLYVLYRQNPAAYYGMITKQAAASKKRYEYCLEHYASATADLAYKLYDLLGSSFDHSVYKKLECELKDRIETCDRISRIFSASAVKNVQRTT